MKNLFVSDLDGTLLNKDKIISKYSIDAINHAIAQGALFTVATARSASSVIEMIKDININAPIVLMNGVFVYDSQNHKYIKYEEIAKPLVHHIMGLLQHYNHQGRMFAFDGEKLVAYTMNGCKQTFPEDADSTYRKIVYTDNFADNCDEFPIVSFVLIDTFDNLKPIFVDIRNNKDLSCCFYEDIYDIGVYWLEIYNSNVNKAIAVDYVHRLYPNYNLITFGDNLNDIEMLKLADNGVCVSNAVSNAKQVANTILDHSNDDNGVAKYIEQLYGDDL